MKIPYVIDNIEHTLADVLNYLLTTRAGADLDIATAYFSIRGFEHVRRTLPNVRTFRLLLGDKPQGGEDLGLAPDSRAFLRHELNAEPLTLETQRLVEELIAFLRRDDVQARLYVGNSQFGNGRREFLHAKCYLLYGGVGNQQVLFDHLFPLVGIVGSSNFTGPGLAHNNELNLVHKTILDVTEVEDDAARAEVINHAGTQVNGRITAENQHLLKSEVGARAILDLAAWFNRQWARSTDFKDELIEILESSKFGGREYTPYEIYMKALFEYLRDDLDGDLSDPATRSAVELTEFQEDAVKKARRILARYDGVIVADSVGLGKTWIGKKLLEDYAYHRRQKALIICPASLRSMWEREMQAASIAATVISQERLGQGNLDLRALADMDVILVDEAHNFRNRLTNRYRTLEMILAANGRRGRDGGRKKLILLTATPINNNIFDLYNQINLFAGNDRAYFATAGIGDLYKYFLAARRESVAEGSIRIFNLLEEVVVRRTRQFIRSAYPEATIGGKRITWPERRLRTVRYDLESTYEGFYQDIVSRIERLNLAHYNLEAYKATDAAKDDFELGREEALVGIFKSRFLKRLESSIDAFRISIRRALEFVKTFDEYIQDDIVLDAASFQSAMRLIENDDESDDGGMPTSRAAAIDDATAARAVLDGLPRLDAKRYNRRRLHHALSEDIDNLTEIWYQVRNIGVREDDKVQELKHLLLSELRGQKVIIFTYYKDTARYLHSALTTSDTDGWLQAMGDPVIRRIDSDVAPADRGRIVEAFAPHASGRSEDMGSEHEIDILVATDVMSEGQNLQDCGVLVNYDLHWNPTRMVQRAGRIDRMGSAFDVLTIHNLFPERELESLLGLVERLTRKIDVINQTGFLDASVLGEVVTPRDFNTLRRIADEDGTVIEEQESFLELASSEALMAELQRFLASEGNRWVQDLDDGIHSGLQRRNSKGVFFYFVAKHAAGGRVHYWRYYDINRREVIDNRYQIIQMIACGPETPRHPPPYHEIDVFEIQEKVLAGIVTEVQHQQAAELVTKEVAQEQVLASDILREHARRPELDRNEIRELRRYLKQPMVGASVQQLRRAVQIYRSDSDVEALLSIVRELYEAQGIVETDAHADDQRNIVRREDLHLICYEYIDA